MSGFDDHRRFRRDDRERSPFRSSEDRGRNRENFRSRVSYGEDRGRSSGGREAITRIQSGEDLSDLPSNVPIPRKDGKILGGQLPQTPLLPKGTAGRPISVLVNHFAIASLPIIKIYQYEIRMAVPLSSQKRGSDKVTAMQQAKVLLRFQSLWGSSFVFDGVSLGWSPVLLVPIGEQRSTTVDLDNHTQVKPNQIDIFMRCTGTLNIKTLVNYLKSESKGASLDRDPAIEECIKMLGALYRQDPASRFITTPRSSAFFQRSPGLMMTLQSTGGILEALRGMYQTIKLSFGTLCINVDVAASAFYTPNLNMVDVARAYAGVSPREDLHKIATSEMFFQACSRMIGMFFYVRHLETSKIARKIRVQRLIRQGAHEATFEEQDHETKETTTTTVSDYFQRKHSILLEFPELPLLSSRDGMFPMELCFTAHGERYKEALQGEETKDFINWATSSAVIRNQQIMENVKRLHWHELDLPKSYGLSVSTKMLKLPARVLSCPIPIYGAGTDKKGPDGGAWNLRGKRFIKPSTFRSWGLFYIPGGNQRVDDKTLQDFTRTLATSLASYGMGTPSGPPAFLLGNPQADLSEAVKHLYGKTGNAFQRKPEIFFFLIHSGASPQIYKIIKNACEITLGVASQVMVVEKVLKKGSSGQMQYLGNVSLKVNCKLGGTNSHVADPFFRRRLMMMGGDSSHPSPGDLRRIPPPPSYSALCASYDPECATYTAVSTAQAATVELIGDFKPMAAELLRRYKEKNGGACPEAILYWRDGISDGHLGAFLESEVKALREVCQGLNIKITVVNCVKRHHTRLFPVQDNQGDKLGNVLPGTVVEASSNNDIFIVTQSALKGCVRPCHYTVIVDDNKLNANDFQRITNNLCFAYGRATRSVGVVPPVYYAHQACERARSHLRTAENTTYLLNVHKDLAYTMYWQ